MRYVEDSKEVGTKSGRVVTWMRIICDTLADLPAPDAYEGITICMGSRAFVIADGSKHVMQSGGQWVQQGASSATYTRAEIDSIVQQIDADILASDITKQGTEIEENADLNSYETAGAFYSPNSTRTGTLSNCPWTGSGFKLVLWSISTTSKMQWLMPMSNSADSIFFRSRTTSGWRPWYKLQGVAVP